jgi:lipopolysaccharide transport system ATP-binding protein
MSSSSQPSIQVEGISKCYRIFERPQDRLLQGLWMGRKNFYREFWALNGVDFSVGQGEVVGIIGRNGSGKSTLLQIISGTLAPTTGQVATRGRVSGLLELGAGFNPEFTGRENVFLSAALLGLSSQATADRFPEIAAFADIGDFLDQPLKFYSSGMLVRLGFALQTVLEPSVLVVDEALAVGDARFQKKCYDYISGFRKRGGTILFVTHDTGIVVQICDWAMILEQGKALDAGEPHRIAKEYHKLLFGAPESRAQRLVANSGEAIRDDSDAVDTTPANVATPSSEQQSSADSPASESRRELRYGSKAVVATRIGVRDEVGSTLSVVETHQALEVFFEVEYRQDITDEVAYGFIFTNSKGLEVFGTKSGFYEDFLPPSAKGSKFECRMDLRVPLVPGSYFVSVALAPRVPNGGEEFFDFRFDALELKVIGAPKCFTTAVVDLNAQLSHRSVDS